MIDDLTNKDGEWDTIGFANGVHEASYQTQKRSLNGMKKKLIQYVLLMVCVQSCVRMVVNWLLSQYLPHYVVLVVTFIASYFAFGVRPLAKHFKIPRKFSLLRGRTQINQEVGKLTQQVTNYFTGTNVDHFDAMVKQTSQATYI